LVLSFCLFISSSPGGDTKAAYSTVFLKLLLIVLF
jgi:hypothetical protein